MNWLPRTRGRQQWLHWRNGAYEIACLQINGTACAVPRLIMAIVENNQTSVSCCAQCIPGSHPSPPTLTTFAPDADRHLHFEVALLLFRLSLQELAKPGQMLASSMSNSAVWTVTPSQPLYCNYRIPRFCYGASASSICICCFCTRPVNRCGKWSERRPDVITPWLVSVNTYNHHVFMCRFQHFKVIVPEVLRRFVGKDEIKRERNAVPMAFAPGFFPKNKKSWQGLLYITLIPVRSFYSLVKITITEQWGTFKSGVRINENIHLMGYL